MGTDGLLAPRPLAELTAENLKRLMEDKGAGAGWYASADLYTWYVGMCEEDELAPVSAKKFGMVLRELGYRRVNQRVEGVMTRGWFISNRALRGKLPRKPVTEVSSPDGYWSSVSVADVDAMLERLGPGEHHWGVIWGVYSESVQAKGWPLCKPQALASIFRNRAYRDQIVRTAPGAKTFRIVTVKCQDDAGAEMSPETVG
jgi:hypothetical protein